MNKIFVFLAASLITWTASAANVAIKTPLDFLLSCQRPSGMLCHYYNRIYYEPYTANSAAYFLLQSHPEQAPFVRRYLVWYLEHLNRPDIWGLSGTIYNYEVTNSTEVVALDHGKPNYDSSDATAGLFLAAASEYYDTTHDRAFFQTHLADFRLVAAAAVGTQDTDGLTWAKPNYKVKYLEDQCETGTGLRLFAKLLQALGQSDWTVYQADADWMKTGIQTMWDVKQNNCYCWAKEANGRFKTNNWSVLVPDAQEQLWPILFDVNPPWSPRANVIWKQFTTALPNWIALNFHSRGGPAPGAAYALVCARMEGKVPPAYFEELSRNFESANYRWPFTPDAAAQLLAIPRGAR